MQDTGIQAAFREKGGDYGKQTGFCINPLFLHESPPV